MKEILSINSLKSKTIKSKKFKTKNNIHFLKIIQSKYKISNENEKKSLNQLNKISFNLIQIVKNYEPKIYDKNKNEINLINKNLSKFQSFITFSKNLK